MSPANAELLYINLEKQQKCVFSWLGVIYYFLKHTLYKPFVCILYLLCNYVCIELWEINHRQQSKI